MTSVLERPDTVTDHRAPSPERRSGVMGVGSERLLVGLGLLVVGVLHSVNLAGWPRYWDDEGTYYSQAWSVTNLGTLTPYTYWYDHPPLGWVQMAAFTWLPDVVLGDANSELLSGRIVMVGYTLVSALLTYVLAKRIGMARGWALAAMLVWALNPLVIFEGRQVFLDNVALPWLLGAFVLILSKDRNLGHHMAAGLCFGIAVLSKETTLIFLPALLLALWYAAYRPTRPFAVMGFTTIVAISGSLYLLFALIRGELFPGPDHVSVWDAVAFQLSGREGSGWLLDPDGPPDGANEAFTGWLALDGGLLIIGGVLAAVAALAVRRLRPFAVGVLTAAAVALRPDGYLPQMFVVAALPFLALLLVGLLDIAWTRLVRAGSVPVRIASGVALVAAVAVAAQPIGDWRYQYEAALGDDTNDVQSEALRYVEENLPRDSTVVTDNAFWNDLVEAGWDAEDVLWFYKLDSDAEVTDQVGGSYLGVDYLLWSVSAQRNAGPIGQEAFEHSELLWTGGSGEDEVQIRRVRSLAEQAEVEATEAAAEAERLETFMAAPSVEYPGLTNGQIEGILVDQETLSVAEMADKYVTTEETIETIVATEESAVPLD